MVASILAPPVTKRLETSMSAYFDLKETGPCAHLKSFILNFIAALCEQLDVEMLQKTAEKVDGKGLEEWRSWYIDETLQIQANALGNFASRVTDLEALSTSSSTKVPCDLGYRNADEFSECWRAAVHLRRHSLKTAPQSTKFQNKRASHEWAPYFSDIFLLKAGNK